MTLTEAPTKCKDDLLCGVNMVEDTDNMSDLEKKHIPVISARDSVKKDEWFEVTVEVGKYLEHPNETKHYIEFIELYADHTYLTRIDFTPEKAKPMVKVMVKLDHIHKKLRAFARCNIHGMWEGHKSLQLTH